MEMIGGLPRGWEGDIDSGFRLEWGLEGKPEFSSGSGWVGLGWKVSAPPFPHLRRVPVRRRMKGPECRSQGNRILIFESILIYQHFHPEPLTHHPEPVEGLHPLPFILSLSKDGLSTTSIG